MKKKLYFAGPWFSNEQAERHTRVYDELLKLKQFEIFNPKLAGNITNHKDCDLFEKIFKANVDNISDADIIVAITDTKDMGTLWECGYAYAKKKPIIYYCETLGNKPFNLMLAKTGKVAKNIDELKSLLEDEKSCCFMQTHFFHGLVE